MILPFTKMHGLGNDFIVINALDKAFNLESQQITKISNRHTGIGFDQLLVIEPPSISDVAFDYRIFNANGQEVEQCGNGARCFARYVTEKKLTSLSHIPVKTNTGLISLYCREDGLVEVDMGQPIFEPKLVPFIADQKQAIYSIDINGESVDASVLSVGNPHVVLNVEDINCAKVNELGPLLESHLRFPNRVNVGFMQVIDEGQISLRVFERGVGETRACGTGACAAVVAGILQGKLKTTVKVDLTGGSLEISWADQKSPIKMLGPADFVFEGVINI